MQFYHSIMRMNTHNEVCMIVYVNPNAIGKPSYEESPTNSSYGRDTLTSFGRSNVTPKNFMSSFLKRSKVKMWARQKLL